MIKFQVEQSLRFLLDCDTGIFKNEETLIHLNTIEAVADNGGWAVEHLDLLIQQLTSVPSPAQISRRIVYSLVPSINIPAHLLVRLALWGLGSSKLSRDCVVLPVLKLISLSLQYDYVTNKQELLCLYELFYLIFQKRSSPTQWQTFFNLLQQNRRSLNGELDLSCGANIRRVHHMLLTSYCGRIDR